MVRPGSSKAAYRASHWLTAPLRANSRAGATSSHVVRRVFNETRKTGRVRRGQIGIEAQAGTLLLVAGLGPLQDWGEMYAACSLAGFREFCRRQSSINAQVGSQPPVFSLQLLHGLFNLA